MPLEIHAHVAAHMVDVAAVERWLSSSRTLHAHTRDDGLYRYIGEAWWGRDFWERALKRRTIRQTYTSMRRELRTMYLFDAARRRCGLSVWTDADYREWWRCEEAYVLSKNR